MTLQYDSIIIGAGPAGITAAVQLKRAGHSVAIIEKDRIGGLLLNARKVENYLGFPDGISGPDLVKHFEEQLKKFEIEVMKAEVTSISKEESLFNVHIQAKPSLQYINILQRSRSVILATGTKPKRAGIKGEEEPEGTRLFYEVCDVPDVPQKSTFLIIGGGDAAFDYALTLDDRGYKPEIITRSKIQCLTKLLDETKRRNIKFTENASLPTNVTEINSDYVLVAVGREPDLPANIKEDEDLYIVGDARGSKNRQVHIATGDALFAAMEVTEFLKRANVSA